MSLDVALRAWVSGLTALAKLRRALRGGSLAGRSVSLGEDCSGLLST